jgi:DNA ligase-associated metallophosphoesterase
MLDILLQGEQVKLLAERALFWPSEKTLIVSDLHWGKSGHFRKHGIAMPAGSQQQDEIRLAKLIREHNVERLVIAGDLFHSVQNNEVEGFSYWRNAHSSLQIHLVVGNHDILPTEKYKSWNLVLHEKEFFIEPFLIVHDAPETCAHFCIHGHIHPAVRVSGIGKQAVKLCCFAEDSERFILPAFGQFTGMHLLAPEDHKHIYLIADDSVIKWK